jgi:hypothetical protein
MEGSCEESNVLSSSIKCSEILEQLHNWLLLKKDSGPWSWLVIVADYIASSDRMNSE